MNGDDVLAIRDQVEAELILFVDELLELWPGRWQQFFLLFRYPQVGMTKKFSSNLE